MSDDIVRPCKLDLQVDDEGTHGLLVFSDQGGATAKLEIELTWLLALADHIPQMVIDASGEKLLGKRSALSSFQREPSTNLTTHQIKTFVLVGQESGSRAFDLLTEKDEIFRFLIQPHVATELSAALAPGGDRLPEGIQPN